MKFPLLARRLALACALGATAIVSAQPRESRQMLIDQLSANFWTPQALLQADQHKQEQDAMVMEVERLLHGKYRITARRIRLLAPIPEVPLPNPVVMKADFHNAMNDIDPNSTLLFSNETYEWPYLNIWKTSGHSPEYVAMSLYRGTEHDTLLGYFELEPTK